MKNIGIFFVTLWLAFPVHAKSGRAILESYEGPKVPGNPAVGSEWSSGQTLTVGPAGEAHVVYADGSQLFVSAGSQLLRTSDGYDLVQGEARTLISKNARHATGAAKGKPASKYKFVVKAKATVMGVRGTDFVVGLKQDQLELNTLEGQVDAAPSMNDLVQGVNRVEVPAGMGLNFGMNAGPSGARPPLPPPQSFDVGAFRQKMVAQHPQMENKLQKVMERMPPINGPGAGHRPEGAQERSQPGERSGERRGERLGAPQGERPNPKFEPKNAVRPPQFAPTLPAQMRPGPPAGVRPALPPPRPPAVLPPPPIKPPVGVNGR